MWHLFCHPVFVQSTFSGSTVRIYKTHAFDEAFFLWIIRMPMLQLLNGLWSSVTNKIDVSTCTRPMDAILGKVLTYCVRLAPWKSHDNLITWQFRKSIFSLSQGSLPLNLVGCWLQGKDSASKLSNRQRLLVIVLISG